MPWKRMWILTDLDKYTGCSACVIACGQENLSFPFHPPTDGINLYKVRPCRSS